MSLPAFGQAPPTPNPDAVEQIKPPVDDATNAPKAEVVVITGTRLQNQFTSASPMEVIAAKDADAKGISDLASLLRDSTVAAGSPQITAITSTAFVQNGGTGVDTISLRGLGANRTLVLLDGKRAGPAGTRGAVGAFDLNVIPLSAIERVDILKDGASSIYGSDAVAGVVNIITKKDDGADIDAFYSAPTHKGGEELRINGSYGATIGNGHFRVTADYFKQEELSRGDRDFFACGQPYVFDKTTGKRADLIDPRTGKASCSGDLLWGQVWVYDYTAPGAASQPWLNAPGFFQYDRDNKLGQYIPPLGPNTANWKVPNNKWFPVGYGELSRPGAPNDPYYSPSAANSDAVLDYHSPFQDLQSLSPEVERMTLYGSGEYDINDHLTLYADALLNRRTTKVHGYRQFWTYQYVYDYGYASSGVPDGTYFGDPLAIADGWGADALGLSPTAITDHAGSTITVDYARVVAGAKGDLDFVGAKGWTWDASLQYSHSSGDYKNDVIWADAIDPYKFRNSLCAGTTTQDRGAPCVDLDWTNPDFLAGKLSAQDRAFLFGSITGNTVYQETSFEAYASGDLFKLPAGPVGAVIGVDWQDDRINDVPPIETQKGWTWGDSSADITKGNDQTKAVFAELAIPILKDVPGFKSLDISASGRYTDVSSYGSGNTYKVGINWQVVPALRFRASQGTSFRSPALFELYLAGQSAFLGQRGIDPCINWAAGLANGSTTQRVADNCAADGVSGTHSGAGSDATVFSSGGAGTLRAETSTAKSLGFVLTPKFLGNLQLSVDYFDVEVDNEVSQLGGPAIVGGCYASLNHATDPLCSLFTRQAPGGANGSNILTVTDDYLNISTQHNRGIDIEAIYRVDLPVGSLSLHGQATRGLEVKSQLQPTSLPRDVSGEIGNPEWVGNLDFTYDLDKWSFFAGFRYVGDTSNVDHFGNQAPTYYGRPVNYVISTDSQTYTNLSVSRDLPWGLNARVGVSNVFDKKPPFVTALSGEYNAIGNVPLDGTQYDFFGRTVFVNLKKTF
jgi:iron complex outermembrane receptor protein